MSPYLFTICAKAFNALIREKESLGQMHGCTTARGAPRITNFFFFDDCFIYLRSIVVESQTIKQTLLEYGLATGQ